MKQVNPRALKALREQKSWSKAELSKKSGIKTRRLIELENENVDFHTIREGSFEGLCYALGATEDQLLGKEPISDPVSVKFVSLQSKITTVAQMNYDLVNQQYGVSSDQLVQLAPLMFAILVEDSFVWRKEQLELRKQIQELEKQVRESQYNPEPDLHDGDVEDAFREEGAAIAAREVFTRPEEAELPDGYGHKSDRFTDFVSAKVKSSEGHIRADLSFGYLYGRDILDPDTRYVAVPELFESLTVPDDVQSTAKLRTWLMSGAMRWSDLFGADDRTADQLAEWFKSEVKPKADALEAVIAPEVYRFDTETEGLSLDEMGFPIRVRRHPNATSETQSEDQGDENEPA